MLTRRTRQCPLLGAFRKSTRRFAASGDQLIADPREPSQVQRLSVHGLGKSPLGQPVETGVERKTLGELAGKILTWPEGMTLQSRVAKIYGDRRKMAEGKLPLDWGYAENMAYATLIQQGFGRIESHLPKEQRRDDIRGGQTRRRMSGSGSRRGPDGVDPQLCRQVVKDVE